MAIFADGSTTTHGEIGKGWASASVWNNSVISWDERTSNSKRCSSETIIFDYT
jgi:hypothetical protein